ncbi:MAG: hypothetical protein E4G97_00570 [Deltaproteobacteria bacterium]|nr:MAG: hypothetical protein E4G97_00570 [Deltaproteobacteria bacterium]
MTIRKYSAGLALLLSLLIAIPPVALADDTELFTTSANPNVLLMLDITGSMADSAAGVSVGDLDGDGRNNSKMDILWKVVYTLLNADGSQPSHLLNDTVNINATLVRAKRSDLSTVTTNNPIIISTTITGRGRNRVTTDIYYDYIVVNSNSTDWSRFPGGTTSGGTVRISSGSQSENMTYTGRSSGSPYTFYFSTPKHFNNSYNTGATISFSYSQSGVTLYPESFPTNRTEAMSADFLNNLTTSDDNTLLARLGLMTFTSSGTTPRIIIRNKIPTTAPNSPPFNPTYQAVWSTVRQYAYAGGGTPTGRALNAAQGFFDTAYNPGTVCRNNFAILITDGEDTLGGMDGSSGNGASPTYYDYSGTFNANGWSGNTGQVARNNAVIQEATNLLSHSPTVKLYTVGVGISDTTPDKNVLREVLRRAAEQTNATASNTEFTAIGGSGDNTSRGAGRAFFATDAESLSYSLRAAFHQMSLGTYSFTAPTVASVRMTDRNYVYKASFSPASPPATIWSGSLQAGTINTDNTISWLWDAGTVLQGTDPSARRIYTYNPGATWKRSVFDNTYITPAMLGLGTTETATRDDLVDYVRGTRDDNTVMLGDIFHSKPIVVGPPSRFYFDEGYSTAVSGGSSFVDSMSQRKRVVYVGTNDGMLHAFLGGTYQTSGVNAGQYDTGTGEELFGYVPSMLLSQLSSIYPGDLTTHGYYVDSSPRVADVWIDSNGNGTKESSEWRTVLISGVRKGGYGYFALDVTNPPTGTDYSNYPKVLWEYTDSANVGQTWSEPFIGKVKVSVGTTTRDRWVALFGGGVGAGGVVGRSFVVLDIATGAAIKTFTTSDGIDNTIVSSPTAILDANGYIKVAYVADLDGSVYKFNFQPVATVSSFSAPLATGSNWSVQKIFQASAGQPVYHRVDAGAIDENSRYLYFGTGNQEFPVSDGGTGKFYAIKDYDSLPAGWPTLPLTESNLADVTVNLGYTSLITGTVAPTQYGWFVNLRNIVNSGIHGANAADTYTHAAEKVLSDPLVFNNNVYFTTFTPNPADPCNGGGVARVYGINMYNATAGMFAVPGSSTSGRVAHYVYAGNPEGGIPSSPSLSIYPSGQSSIFVGFSTGAIKEIKIDSPAHYKTIKSWKEVF